MGIRPSFLRLRLLSASRIDAARAKHAYFCRTSKLSHAHGRRGSCSLRFRIRLLHSTLLSLAGAVTDVGVGSGALLGQRTRGRRWLRLKGEIRVNRVNASSLLRDCNVEHLETLKPMSRCASAPALDSWISRRYSQRAAKKWGTSSERRIARPTSKMSHAHGRHDSCSLRLLSPRFHSVFLSLARGMTDVGVGSGALFGFLAPASSSISSKWNLCRKRWNIGEMTNATDDRKTTPLNNA